MTGTGGLALGSVPGRGHRGDDYPVPGQHGGGGGGGHQALSANHSPRLDSGQLPLALRGRGRAGERLYLHLRGSLDKTTAY